MFVLSTVVTRLWLASMAGEAGAGPVHQPLADEVGCGLELPSEARLAPPIPEKHARARRGAFETPFLHRTSGQRSFQSGGILDGKTVYVSAGHGFSLTDYGWRAQRGNTHGIVEDLVSIEAVNAYLIPYLHAMGAYVVPLRESDFSSQRFIVDDVDAVSEGQIEDGPNAGRGWGETALPIRSDDVAPFSAGDARSLVAETEETGGLVYPVRVEQAESLSVYVSHVQGPDRVSDAHWVVRHAGGETHLRIDQRRHGSTWILLGRFHFEPGADDSRSSVSVRNDSMDAGIISADAIRVGGGMAVHDRGTGVHPRPMAEQCARYYAQWNGAPPSVFDASSSDASDDVSTRSRFAAWEHEPGEDAVYVAWHSNAPSPQRGTSSFTYSEGGPYSPLEMFSGAPGSRSLQDSIHGWLVGDIRTDVDPEWVDEDRHTAYFGEINPSHNPQMPSVLVEVAYHSTFEDAIALREPGFRRVAARAMARGIAAYFADADGVPLVLPPPPPNSLGLRNDGEGGLIASWDEPELGQADPPSSYLVQVSHTGHGFDEGTPTSQTEFRLEGLSAGDTRFVRVLAVNEGGRSLPSSIVGASVAASGTASVLVVDGFDRLDGGILTRDDLSDYDLGLVDRMRLPELNDFSYVVRHGQAIARSGYSFDSVTDDVIESGAMNMLPYQAVDWFSGTESVADEPFSGSARERLAEYLDDGGGVFVSGAELGWALDANGTDDTRAFYREVLRVEYEADDAGVDEVAGLPGGPFDDALELSFADPAVYYPRFPDALRPAPQARPALGYAGADTVAATVWDRGVVFGFPFETIEGEQTRVEVMADILAHLEMVEAPGSGGSQDTGDPGGTGDDSSSGGWTTRGGETGNGDGIPPVGTGSGVLSEAGGCSCRTKQAPPSPALVLFVLLFARGVRSRREPLS